MKRRNILEPRRDRPKNGHRKAHDPPKLTFWSPDPPAPWPPGAEASLTKLNLPGIWRHALRLRDGADLRGGGRGIRHREPAHRRAPATQVPQRREGDDLRVRRAPH